MSSSGYQILHSYLFWMNGLTSQSPSQHYYTRLYVWGWWLWNWATAVDVHKIAYKLCTISDWRVGANMKFYIRFPLHESIPALHTYYVPPAVPRSGRFFYIETVFPWAGNFSKTSISARSAGVGKYKALALLPGKIFSIFSWKNKATLKYGWKIEFWIRSCQMLFCPSFVASSKKAVILVTQQNMKERRSLRGTLSDDGQAGENIQHQHCDATAQWDVHRLPL